MIPPRIDVRGNPKAVEAWAEACRRCDDRERSLATRLKQEGVKALHPDDGWVNREEGTVRLAYPMFRHREIGVGDIIAVSEDMINVSRFTVTVVYPKDPELFGFARQPKGPSGDRLLAYICWGICALLMAAGVVIELTSWIRRILFN